MSSLAALPRLLREDPAVTRALGDPAGFVAVPEAARAITVAALAQLSDRRPLVVACPTGTDAGQLFDDLCQYMPDGEVALFPGWETLPFERVSPSVETMGRRLEVLWRVRDPERCPAVVVAGVRALLQHLGPGTTELEPIHITKGAVLDPDDLLSRLVHAGYRREELVEHRGEVARRGAIIDIFPSTADSPIRIDLWGDEVDRLTEFGVNDQRSTHDLAEAYVFAARELVPNDAVRERAARLVATEPWGREQWERLAEGALFDGMESWLPWLIDDDELITDVLPPTAKVALVEPRRMRDRANDLLAEEDDLARALASTWERDAATPFPRLHAEPERLLGAKQSTWTISSAPETPDSPMVTATGWGPVVGDGEGLTNRLRDLVSDGYRVIVAADGEGSAQRMAELLLERGLDFGLGRTGEALARPGGYITVAPLHRGCTVGEAKVAVIAESDLTGRRRAHRQARPRRRQATGLFEDLKPGNYVVHYQHGVGQYEGMVKRTIGGVERDYLLLAYKGG
ncbi:MAG TPA: CarD family transcriptional regulator, partial [Ilumatobacteraceae bacterium]|nr:CarD family transcriptional regulator [Ilumatobacteraceae bacterium]